MAILNFLFVSWICPTVYSDKGKKHSLFSANLPTFLKNPSTEEGDKAKDAKINTLTPLTFSGVVARHAVAMAMVPWPELSRGGEDAPCCGTLVAVHTVWVSAAGDGTSLERRHGVLDKYQVSGRRKRTGSYILFKCLLYGVGQFWHFRGFYCISRRDKQKNIYLDSFMRYTGRFRFPFVFFEEWKLFYLWNFKIFPTSFLIQFLDQT